MTSSIKEEYKLVIESEGWKGRYLKDIWEYLELMGFLALRDVLVRYRYAFFGVAWSVLKPTITMLIFTLIFRKMAHLSSGEVNYGLFVLAGMLPFQLFSGSLAETSFALIGNANLVTKIYFPRMILPIAQIGVHLIDFVIGLLFLLVLIVVSGQPISPLIALLPMFISLCLLLSIGAGFWFSALMVSYRDFKFIVPIILQFGIFVSPVGYASDAFPEQWSLLYAFNPLVGIIDGFRWSLYGTASPNFILNITVSIAVTLFVLISGFYYFRKVETFLADRI
jgi:lipopolysaccharide transport system permease protein